MLPFQVSRLRVGFFLSVGVSPLLADVGTPSQREALFESIAAKTRAREAFAPIKNSRLGLDWEKAMASLRADFARAESDDDLYYALVRASNARLDRHLSITPTAEGLRPWFIREGLDYENPPGAPVRFLTDFSTGAAFISEVASNYEFPADATAQPGDIIEAVNGLPWANYVESVRPYLRHSSEIGFRWHVTVRLNQRHPDLPLFLALADLNLTLRRTNGQTVAITVPYAQASHWVWPKAAAERYPGFKPAMQTSTYELYRNDGRRALLIVWKGFREKMQPDVDQLVAYAQAENLLAWNLIWDGTGSRGGSAGAYALQRFVSQPFKLVLGNLRISDITPAFIVEKERQFAAKALDDGGVPETMDGGGWLMDWLRTDVKRGIADKQDYTNAVPFKGAHAPAWSDGLLKPAPLHFTGNLVVLLGPQGGSHLDQFVAMIKDNQLGTIIGMPAGGYSNTWEWEEKLKLPGTDQPLVNYMWNIGHSIRPNGQILEGNPAEPDVLLPLTHGNFKRYHADLLVAAFQKLDEK